MKNKIILSFKRLQSNKVLLASLVVFIGLNIANFAQYVFNIIEARLLVSSKFNGSAYGEFYSLNSFSFYFTIPITAITLISTKLIAEWHAHNEKEKIGYFLRNSTKQLTILFCIFTLFGLFTVPLIKNFFRFDDFLPIIILLLSITLTFVSATMLGALTGTQQFIKHAAVMAFSGLGRLVVGTICTLYFGVTGALIGNLVTPIIYIFLSLIFVKEYFYSNKSYKFKFKYPKNLLIGTIISTLAFGSFLSTDVILVKHYLTNEYLPNSSLDIPSIFSMLSMFGRIIYFFTYTFAIVILPLSSFSKAKGENSDKILFQILLFTSFFLIPLVILYFTIPRFLITIVSGSDYTIGAKYLGEYGLAVALYSVAAVLNNYLISLNKFRYAIIPAFFAIIEIVLFIFYHRTIATLINIQIVINVLMFLSFIIYTLHIRRTK